MSKPAARWAELLSTGASATPGPILPGVHGRVDEEFVAALEKHGDRSIAMLAQDDPRWLPILVEEVGEVSEHLLTHGHLGQRDHLYIELIQVAAVALAWAEAVLTSRGES